MNSIKAELPAWPKAFPNTSYELLRRSAERRPDAVAITDIAQTQLRLTYKQWLKITTQTANLLTQLGVRRNQAVALLLPNLPETSAAVLAAQTVASALLLNEQAASTWLSAIDQTKASILFTLAPHPDNALWALLQPLLPQMTSLRHIIFIDMPKPALGGWQQMQQRWQQQRYLWQRHGLGGLRVAVPFNVAIHHYHKAIADQDSESLRDPYPVRARDTATLWQEPVTGRLLMRSQRQELANVAALAQHFAEQLAYGKHLLLMQRVLSADGLIAGVLWPLWAQATVWLSIQPEQFKIVPTQVAVCYATTEWYQQVQTVQDWSGLALTNLESGRLGLSPMWAEAHWQVLYGLNSACGWSGVTEALLTPPIDQLGRCPAPQQAIIVKSHQQGRIEALCQVNEVGRLAVAGPHVSLGYWQTEQQLAWVEDDQKQQWLLTPLWVVQDEQGDIEISAYAYDVAGESAESPNTTELTLSHAQYA